MIQFMKVPEIQTVVLICGYILAALAVLGKRSSVMIVIKIEKRKWKIEINDES